MEDLPPHLSFPKTFDTVIIEEYLERELLPEEENLIENFRVEYEFNNKLESLHKICGAKNLCIPVLTQLDGNCLFESLVYHGIGTSIEHLRKVISTLLCIFKDHKNFFPDEESTLQELFTMANEIQYVVCNDSNFYTYTYDTMCQDLLNKYAWDRLPTQIILMVISYVYKLEIIILNNNSNYVNNINVFKNKPGNNIEIKKLHLGHIHEAHYFPLVHNNNGTIPIYYDTYQEMMSAWVRDMERIKYYSQ